MTENRLERFLAGGERALIWIGALFFLFIFHKSIGGDGTPRYLAIEALYSRGELYDMKYSLIGPLFASPLYWLGELVKSGFWWMKRFNALVIVCSLVGFYYLLRHEWSPQLRRRFLLLILAGSMFAKHAEEFYGEVFTAVMVSIGLACMVYRRPVTGWILAALGTANAMATIVPLTFACGYLAVMDRRLRNLAPVLLSLVFIFGENLIRRGKLWVSVSEYQVGAPVETIMPYSSFQGFEYPLLFGLLSITLSFGKGIFFYSPGLLLGFGKPVFTESRLRRLCGAWMFYVIGLVLLYSKWVHWHGDRFWGPRYFLFTVFPAILLLAGALVQKPTGWRNFFVLLILTLSVWVGANGVSFGLSNMNTCIGQYEFLCWYTPEFSALWRPFIAPPILKLNDYVTLGFFALAYLVLAIPRWIQLVRDTRKGIKSLWYTYGGLTGWRI